MTEEKASLIDVPENDEILEIKEVGNPHELGYNEFSSYSSDCPTTAY